MRNDHHRSHWQESVRALLVPRVMGCIVDAAGQVEEEPEAPAAASANGEAAPKGSRRKAYSNMRREISDKEFSSPVVVRFLADEIDRLEDELLEYKKYRREFHDADKKVALLGEKIKTQKALDIISIGCLTSGGALLGLAPKMWDSQPSGIIMAIAGTVLIVLGVFAKVVKS